MTKQVGNIPNKTASSSTFKTFTDDPNTFISEFNIEPNLELLPSAEPSKKSIKYTFNYAKHILI